MATSVEDGFGLWAYAINQPCLGHRGKNSYAERFIGSIRRECLDHGIILSKMYQRRIMKTYVEYDNRRQTHLALREVSPPLAHDPEKWEPVFGKDHALTKC